MNNALHKLHYASSPALRLLVAALLVTLVFAGGYAVSAHKTVTLTVDGTQVTVSTMKSHVIDVVKENGFDVGERDDLYPAADTDVHQSDTIVLRRSRPLQISLDGQDSRQVWTTASTVQDALTQLSMTDTAPAAASRGLPFWDSRIQSVVLSSAATPSASAWSFQRGWVIEMAWRTTSLMTTGVKTSPSSRYR